MELFKGLLEGLEFELFKGLLEGLEFELLTIALLVGRELALIDRGLDTQTLVKDVDNHDAIEGHDDDDRDEGDNDEGLVGWSPGFVSAGMNHCQTQSPGMGKQQTCFQFLI